MTRFFCDEMLHRLGRWLRAAGYDTVLAAGGLPDRVLAARCAEEDRVLLTKDRHLAAIVRRTAPVVLLPSNGIDEAARALRIALNVDWRTRRPPSLMSSGTSICRMETAPASTWTCIHRGFRRIGR